MASRMSQYLNGKTYSRLGAVGPTLSTDDRFRPKADTRSRLGRRSKSAIVRPELSLGDTMSLSDLAALGSFVSGLAVAVTLILLLLQMRQSDRNQRASMQLGLATRANDLYARMSDPEFALFMTKARMRPNE